MAFQLEMFSCGKSQFGCELTSSMNHSVGNGKSLPRESGKISPHFFMTFHDNRNKSDYRLELAAAKEISDNMNLITDSLRKQASSTSIWRRWRSYPLTAVTQLNFLLQMTAIHRNLCRHMKTPFHHPRDNDACLSIKIFVFDKVKLAAELAPDRADNEMLWMRI